MAEQTKQAKIEYFLGANTGRGFFSHYDKLIDQSRANAFYVIKGGPGSGKSTLMHMIAEKLTNEGLHAEYIRCSGDPDSLDGVLFPAIRAAVVDGTSPHVIEPQYCGLTGGYIDLSRACDPAKLTGARERLIELYPLYRAQYARAWRYILAADQVMADTPGPALTEELSRRIRRRAAGIAAREFPVMQREGERRVRFLSAVSCKGELTLWDSVYTQCARVYELTDRYHVSHIMLDELMRLAVKNGHEAVCCMSPRAPEKIEQLILPGLSLAFVTSRGEMKLPQAPTRRLRLDLTVEKALDRDMRARQRFSEKLDRGLMNEAVTALGEAKALHDELEALYNPAIDFTVVHEAAEKYSQKLLML